jgi:hypothetical protein
MATVQNANPHGPLDLARLAAFEARLGAELPADYRQFLLVHNGGDFVPDEIVLPGQAEPFATMGQLFGLFDGPFSLEAVCENVEDVIPAEVVAFAEDVGGNLLCIGIRGAHRGKVYFWDHNGSLPGEDEPCWSGMTLLAPSFAEFVSALGGPQPGEEFGITGIWSRKSRGRTPDGTE